MVPVIVAGQNKSPVDSASHLAAHVRRERGKSLKLVSLAAYVNGILVVKSATDLQNCIHLKVCTITSISVRCYFPSFTSYVVNSPNSTNEHD